MSLLRTWAALPALLLFLAPAAPAQTGDGVEIVADGLVVPLGVEIDADGQVWVAESGSGNNDGRVSVLVDGALQPVIEGLPSVGFDGEVDGAAHLLLTDTAVWVIGGAGPEPAFDILRFERAALTPGTPVGPDAASFEASLSEWVLDQGYAESNVYAAVQAADGALWVTDAAANALFRYDPGDRSQSVIAEFESVETGATPPIADAVPTGIALDGDAFLVGTLTGFPFADGAAKVLSVASDGAVSTVQDGLTVVTDVAVDPRDGRPVALEMARFTPQDGYIPGTGRLVKLLDGGEVAVLADGLNLATAIAFDADGVAYVTSLFGQLVRVMSAPVATEQEPAGALALAAGPNPFQDATRVRFDLGAPAYVRLVAYDAVGRRVAVLAEGPHTSGAHEVSLDGATLAVGVYVVRLEAGDRSESVVVVRAR